FFFSSRSRHTRFSRDWSSDVCSSDLQLVYDLDGWALGGVVLHLRQVSLADAGHPGQGRKADAAGFPEPAHVAADVKGRRHRDSRSEERRVGKECRLWWEAGHAGETER